MIVQSQADINQLKDRLSREPIIVVDTETNGLNPFKGDRIVGIAFYFPNADESYYLPTQHDMTNSRGYKNIRPLDYVDLIGFVGDWPYKNVIMFNSKFDLHMLEADGWTNPCNIEDVMIAAHLLNENEDLSNGKGNPQTPNYRPQTKGAYTLKRLAKKYLGRDRVQAETNLEMAAQSLSLDAKADIWRLPLDIVAAYAEDDVRLTWELREFYMPALERWGLYDLYVRRNAFILKVLIRMEHNGMRVNPQTIAEHQATIEPRMEELQAKYPNINLGSPKQVLQVLQTVGYDVEDTSVWTLQELAGDEDGDQFAKDVLAYRNLKKADSTYYKPYLELRDVNNVVHYNFNLLITSGRLGCQGPNMQQVPRTSERYAVKEVFEFSSGYTGVEIDYSQLELRLAVHYAREETMRRMMNAGEDLHQFTADQLGITRYQGKTANFGLLYGMGPEKAARQFKTNLEESKRIHAGWHSQYPAFRQALNNAQALARQWRDHEGNPGGKFQYVRLADGRCRRFHEFTRYPFWWVTKDNWGRKDPPYSAAWNFIVQGTAAMITEISLLRIAERFPDNNEVRLLLTVHDSVIMEIRDDLVDEYLPIIANLMTDHDFNPRLEVDIKTSKTTWKDMKP